MIVETIQNTLLGSSPEVLRPYVSGVFGAFVLVLKVGLIAVLCLEIFKRIERLFISEDNPNWRIVHRERPFFKREFWSELCWPLVNPLILVPLLGAQQYLFVESVLTRHIPQQPFAASIEVMPLWAQVLLGLLVLDLTLYVRHRFVHHFFWPYHTIHHSAREITWLTMMRLHPIDTFVMGIIETLMLHFFGFSGQGIVLATVILFYFNMFAHSNLALDFPGPLRYIFVSPNMHRWHHAGDDPKAYNKNFAIVFAFIDLAFGSFYVPKNRLPGTYGVLDEEGQQVVSERFIDQFLYPLRCHKRWLVARYRALAIRRAKRRALKKSGTA